MAMNIQSAPPQAEECEVREPEALAPGLQPQLLHSYRHDDGDPPPTGITMEEDAFEIGDAPQRTGWRRLLHPLVLVVAVPTLLTAAFEYLVAADQYESDAQFIVRTPQQNATMNSVGQMLGMSGGAVATDAHSVDAYLLSHDAVDALGARRLTATFRRPEADPVTRLWFANPLPETLLKYYRGMVHVTTAAETGITTLTVRSYRPEDAKALADDLLRLGEARTNMLNERMFADGLSAADRQVHEAEAMVEAVEGQMTSFRQAHRDADPERSGAAQIQLAATLQQQAAQARAQFDSMAAVLPRSAPQYAANARQVAALERQVASVKAGLAGSERSVAAGLGEYEKLQMRQQFAAKRYDAAQASYQSAREQLLKQQLFIIPVVKPNLPGKALYPERLTVVATVFFGLLFAYAIGWLILAGIREHAE
jgi:capsular polysaccharide transport system permease protein